MEETNEFSVIAVIFIQSIDEDTDTVEHDRLAREFGKGLDELCTTPSAVGWVRLLT